MKRAITFVYVAPGTCAVHNAAGQVIAVCTAGLLMDAPPDDNRALYTPPAPICFDFRPDSRPSF